MNDTKMQTSTFDYRDFFSGSLQALHREERYRVFANLERHLRDPVRAYDHRTGRDVTIWCSNDYLGMSVHPEVLSAAAKALDSYGAGAGGLATSPGQATSM